MLAQTTSYNEFMANAGIVLLPIATFCVGIFFWKLYRYFQQKLLVWLSSVYFIRFALYAILLWLGKISEATGMDILLMLCLFFASFMAEIFFYILLLPKLGTLKKVHLKKRMGADNVS